MTARRRVSLPPALLIGGLWFGVILLLVLLSFIWLPYDPQAMDIPNRLLPPSAAHPFGTDQYGRDVLSNIIAGGRTSLAVAFGSLIIGAGIGVPSGLLAAAARGWADEILARSNDVLFAFPALLIAALIASIAGPSAVEAAIAIGIFNIPVFARITRVAAIGQWHRDYVPAAITSGKTRGQIVLGHILPNLLPILLVQSSVLVSLAILAEAGLAYIGLGTQPPTPSWGSMLTGAQTLIDTAPWLAIFPGLAILFTAFALNLISDGLRDMLDPRLRRVILGETITSGGR